MTVPADRGFVRHRSDPARGHVFRGGRVGTAPPDPLRASVIIPTRDGFRGGYLSTLLQQLGQQSCQDFELYLVQGDSRQGRAINTAAALARAPILVTLDDDTRLGGLEVLGRLLDVLDHHPDIGMAGVANLIPADASWVVRRAMREIPRRHSSPVDEITDSDLAEHPCCAIRRDLFLAVGGENELIPRGLDPYLRHEIRQAGYRVVVIPGPWIHHLPPPSLRRLLGHYHRNGQDAGFCNRHFPGWAIETPVEHGSMPGVVSPWRRRLRFPLRLLQAFVAGEWIYAAVLIAYGTGVVRETLWPRSPED